MLSPTLWGKIFEASYQYKSVHIVPPSFVLWQTVLLQLAGSLACGLVSVATPPPRFTDAEDNSSVAMSLLMALYVSTYAG